jgi:hypothetical protein
MMNGQLIVKTQNAWLLVEEYGEAEGLVVLNKITNHEGEIPYDSVREKRKPDLLILRAQVNLGKGGVFETSPFLDGPETEIMTEEEEILPARMAHVETVLRQCTPEGVEVLKDILIKQPMVQGEIESCAAKQGVPNVYKFCATISGRTSLLDFGERQKVSIKPAFVPILEKLLLRPKTNTAIRTPQPPQSS